MPTLLVTKNSIVNLDLVESYSTYKDSVRFRTPSSNEAVQVYISLAEVLPEPGAPDLMTVAKTVNFFMTRSSRNPFTEADFVAKYKYFIDLEEKPVTFPTI